MLYVIQTQNMAGDVQFAELEIDKALQFVRDQLEMGFDCSISLSDSPFIPEPPMENNCDHDVHGDMCIKCGYRW
jgi:hypothetical protein